LLAVDRDNPQVAHLFQPLHPSVLQCLRRIAAVASDQRKPARICGEVSSNPLLAVLLIGMGFRQLSMNPFAIPLIRKTLGRVRLPDAENLARTTLKIATAQDTAEYLIREVPHLVGMELGEFAAELRSPLVPWNHESGS
jgi:signal transduction protein with GAF and PtsI domain